MTATNLDGSSANGSSWTAVLDAGDNVGLRRLRLLHVQLEAALKH